MRKTTIAMVLGDPAGIGPELIARLLAEPEVRSQAHVILIADEAEMRRGMRLAGQEFPYRRVESLEQLSFTDDTPLFALGEPGNGVGELWHPGVIRLLPDDRYLIADPGNWRFSIFKRDGTHLHSFGSKGLRNGQIMAFGGMEVDSEGRVYVVDCAEHRVVVFEPVECVAE